VKVQDLSRELDALLKSATIPDSSQNGIQVENRQEIRRLATAVDASVETVKKAVAAGAQALLVHHGFLWKDPVRLTGRFYPLVKALLDADMALLAQHLPLDIHPEYGNNAVIARELGLEPGGFFSPYHGVPIVLGAHYQAAIPMATFIERAAVQFGKPLAVIEGGKPSCSRVAICSGGGGGGLMDAVQWGADAFLTGDANHWLYHAARELGVTVVCAGHYATETRGVRAVGETLASRFGLEHAFIDVPTGL